jgi:hypothetical protein
MHDARPNGALAAMADDGAGPVAYRMTNALLVIDQGLAKTGFLGTADEGLLLPGLRPLFVNVMFARRLALRGAASCQGESREDGNNPSSHGALLLGSQCNPTAAISA